MARIPNALDSLTPQLRAKAEEMKKARGLPNLGFYEDLMIHPELFARVEALGSFLRFHGSLPGRLREAVILMAAVEQRSAFEWQTHQKTARLAGLTEEEITAIGQAGILDPPLDRIRTLVSATIHDQAAPQDDFDILRRELGNEAAIEIIVLAAFYRMMSGLGSAFESKLPGAETPPWQENGNRTA